MKVEILRSEIRNNKVIVILRNDFNNLHVAIWDGSNLDAIKSIYSPANFKMTGSFGKNSNDTFLNAKFNNVVNNSFLQNFQAIK